MSFDLSRRFAIVGAGVALIGRPAASAELLPTPGQTEGPFYPTAFPADADGDLVQVRGQAAQAMGTVLHLQGRILNLSGGPVPRGTVVEIWQCDSQGLYDHPRQPGRERRDVAFQGYGAARTDADGRYRFRTLTPVAYPGRTPHIHLKVETPETRRLTTQFYLAGDPRNESDGVWRQAVRGNPRDRAMIEMRLEPANGLEAGAFTTWMDIVLSSSPPRT
jgi:protocatechuate 3,4-dioxygenase beta subunit